jgi:hypothetical protein
MAPDSPDRHFNVYEQFFIMESKIQQLEFVYQCNGLEEDEQPVSRSYTRIIWRNDRYGLICSTPRDSRILLYPRVS